MQVMTATSIANTNASWLNMRGMWLGYLTSVAILHFVLMSVPLISTPMAWTLTHVIHNVVSGGSLGGPGGYLTEIPAKGFHLAKGYKILILWGETLLTSSPTPCRVCTSCSTT